MSKNALFCLSDVGYLHDVIHASNSIIARVYVINKYETSNGKSDDLWIDCEVKDEKLVRLFNNIEPIFRKGRAIVINFKASYSCFSFARTGMTKEDPDHIVQLKGCLLEVKKTFVDGIELNNSPIGVPKVLGLNYGDFISLSNHYQ